jgi:hypothetical protein
MQAPNSDNSFPTMATFPTVHLKLAKQFGDRIPGMAVGFRMAVSPRVEKGVKSLWILCHNMPDRQPLTLATASDGRVAMKKQLMRGDRVEELS